MMEEQSVANMGSLLKVLSSRGIIKIIDLLYQNPLPYIRVVDMFGYERRSIVAYYFRKMKRQHIINKDRNDFYYLTFRGMKIYELLVILEKIAGLSIEKMGDMRPQCEIDLEKSQSWLKPMLKNEIRLAVKELKS